MEFWQLIEDVWENDIARVFSLAITVVFVLSLLTYHIATMAAFSRHGSTLCTTLGVLARPIHAALPSVVTMARRELSP